MMLPKNWQRVDEARACALEAELRREVPGLHRLNGLQLRAIAEHGGRDDVVFAPLDVVGPVHVVHLTWAVESDPAWPWTVSFVDVGEFERAWAADTDE